MTDPFIPWISLSEPEAETTGPLAGLRLAVKDLFDVAGLPTGAGNPRWLETHEVPREDAAAVARLREAGAILVGKTITDELAWSLNGTNVHYGTPLNPSAPGRMPGGSSSGSASAVALGRADIGLGTDTGGSIRVPASYCGLFGLRPTHGRISLDGAVPLAPSFDTAGVLTRDAATLQAATGALLSPQSRTGPIMRILAPRDVWDEAAPELRRALEPALERFGLHIERDRLFDDDAEFDRARAAYVTLQSSEAHRSHAEWIAAAEPEFGPGVAARFARAATVTADDVGAASLVRERITELLGGRLSGGTALAIPAAPGPSPRLGDRPDRDAVVRLTSLAGLSGTPALALPAGRIGDLPVGLQLVAAPGGDEALLALADQA